MTSERLCEIMEDYSIDSILLEIEGDNACMGLDIVRKYLPKGGIEAAEHDVIYSVTVDKICEAGITEEDAIQLKKLNWMIEGGNLACFV